MLLLGRRKSVSFAAEVPRREPALDLPRGGLWELVGDKDAGRDLSK